MEQLWDLEEKVDLSGYDCEYAVRKRGLDINACIHMPRVEY